MKIWICFLALQFLLLTRCIGADHFVPIPAMLFEPDRSFRRLVKIKETLKPGIPIGAQVQIIFDFSEHYPSIDCITLHEIGARDDERNLKFDLEITSVENPDDLEKDDGSQLKVRTFRVPIEASLGLRMRDLWRLMLLETAYLDPSLHEAAPRGGNVYHHVVFENGTSRTGMAPNAVAEEGAVYWTEYAGLHLRVYLLSNGKDAERFERFSEALKRAEDVLKKRERPIKEKR